MVSVDRTTLYRWERRGLVKPLRDYRGWRFYRPEDIERLRRWREPKPVTLGSDDCCQKAAEALPERLSGA